MNHYLRTVARLSYLNLRTQMEYRFQFFLWLIIKVLSYGSAYLTTWLILARFNGVGGWSIAEVIVLWALVQFGYTLAAPFFFAPIGKIAQFINAGTFDHYLVQPLPPLANLIARHFSWTYSSQALLNIVVLVVILPRTSFSWSAPNVILLGLSIISGVCFYAFTFLLGGAASFRWLETGRRVGGHIRWLMDLTQYPLSIYPAVLRAFLTFVIPAALINYYPALVFFHKIDTSSHPYLPLLIPLVPIALCALGFSLFKRGLDQYQGGGG